MEGFSDATQLHGRFILELKKKWPCQQHYGEHGELGFCYVTPAGEHIHLNSLHLKAWAAAMVKLFYFIDDIKSDMMSLGCWGCNKA